MKMTEKTYLQALIEIRNAYLENIEPDLLIRLQTRKRINKIMELIEYILENTPNIPEEYNEIMDKDWRLVGAQVNENDL